jgi:hypothetical protein
MEQLHETRALRRRKFIAGQPPGDGDRAAHLFNEFMAWRAQSNVLLELGRLGRRERTFKVVRHYLDKFPAG